MVQSVSIVTSLGFSNFLTDEEVCCAVLPGLKNFLEISRDFTFFQDCLKITGYL